MRGLALPDPRMATTGVGGMERSDLRRDSVETTGGPQETTLVPRLLATDGVTARLDPQEDETRSPTRRQETHRVSQLAHQFETPTGNRIDLGPMLREFEGIIT